MKGIDCPLGHMKSKKNVADFRVDKRHIKDLFCNKTFTFRSTPVEHSDQEDSEFHPIIALKKIENRDGFWFWFWHVALQWLSLNISETVGGAQMNIL